MEGVSVVIPCLNEEQYINDCLLGIVNNGFDNSKIEILVVDGGSNDKTITIIQALQEEYSFIKIVNNERKKTPFALNLGIKNAKFNKVLIAGAHANYPKGYLFRLNELLEQPDIDAIGGVLETKAKNITPKSEAICYVLSHPLGVGNSTFRLGANKLIEVDTVPFGLYKKEVFEKIGYYNERLIRNHDMELSSRIKSAGYKIWLEPNFACTYYARETFSALAKNNYGNGLWNLKTLAITSKISSLRLRHYIPMLFVLSIVFSIVAGLMFSILPLLILGAGILLLHAFILLMVAVKLRSKSVFYVWYAFLVLHYSYGVGSIVGLFSWFNVKK